MDGPAGVVQPHAQHGHVAVCGQQQSAPKWGTAWWLCRLSAPACLVQAAAGWLLHRWLLHKLLQRRGAPVLQLQRAASLVLRYCCHTDYAAFEGSVD